MASGYQVSPAGLQAAAAGINGTIAELKTLGFTESAEEGRGFGNLELTGVQTGHEGLRSSFADFCNRWSWGVRTLVKDGNSIAQQLGVQAGTYHDNEQYVVGVRTDAVNAVAGNPRASEDQVEKSSFGQILTNTPDYSAASFQKAGQTIAKTWSGVAKDAAQTAKNIAEAAGPAAQAELEWGL
jgi:hypothetical protein